MQKIKNYLRYISFFLRYNPFLAIFAFYDELKGESQYNLSTSGIERNPFGNSKPVALFYAYSYMPSNYVLLQKVFQHLNTLHHNHSFLDIGCGKGRAMAVAAHFGFKEIIGIDISQQLCEVARDQLKKKDHLFPDVTFQVICTDACSYKIPPHIQTIFLYNPFREPVIDLLLSNILESIKNTMRQLYIIYLNPLYKQRFLQAGYKEIYTTDRFFYLKASILCL